MCVTPRTTYTLLGGRNLVVAEVVVETEAKGVFLLMHVWAKAVVQPRVGRQYVFLPKVLGISLKSDQQHLECGWCGEAR